MSRKNHLVLPVLILLAFSGCNGRAGSEPQVRLLNVSYDPTREFYQEYNASFVKFWRQKSGQNVLIEQSHGGAGKQARSVIDGLEADVVTLALAYDIDAISSQANLMPSDWQSRLPHNSSPYTSTIVFLVRKGNPKGIRNWSDLVEGDISIITTNPKTSGGARWNYLAAWGSVLKHELGSLEKLKTASPGELAAAHSKAKAFMQQIFKRVPVLDSGARGSTNTFAQRGLGDVLLTWENEAFLAVHELGKDQFEIVVPSLSILAEPPVTVVDTFAKKHGTLEVAQAYLEYLYSPEGQQLAARHYYRPRDDSALTDEQRNQFVDVELFTIDDVFGGWAQAQAEHFADGGTFDQIYQLAK